MQLGIQQKISYNKMLEIAIVAFVISLIAGALGFTGIARGSAKIAKFFFVLFLIVALIFIGLFVLGISIIT